MCMQEGITCATWRKRTTTLILLLIILFLVPMVALSDNGLSDIRTYRTNLESAVQESTEVNAQTLAKLKIDVVWVMSTTFSMMPYITQTLKVVEDASKRISANPELTDSIHFGVWGYRDSMEIPGIGYNTKNYTPELQTIEQFVNTLKTVDVTTSALPGYSEDVFSGVSGAVDQTSWTPDALKLIILIGSAPSHEVGHKWNASGQSQDTLRAIADDRQISIFALHIKDPQAEKYHESAIEQFQALSMNKGAGDTPSYFAVASDDLPGFEKATKDVTDVVIGLIEEIRKISNNQPAQENTSLARQLQLEGTLLQLKGDLEGAVKKYEESISCKPNLQLEKLVKNIERIGKKTKTSASILEKTKKVDAEVQNKSEGDLEKWNEIRVTLMTERWKFDSTSLCVSALKSLIAEWQKNGVVGCKESITPEYFIYECPEVEGQEHHLVCDEDSILTWTVYSIPQGDI